MQLHLKNIGPIDIIDINVDSDLTFIYGENNIGKSYAITILYLVLKSLVFDTPYPIRFSYRYMQGEKFDNNLVENINKNLINSSEFDITDIVAQYFSNFISSMFLPRFEDSLRNSFGDISNLNNKISNESFELCIEFEEYNINITEKNNKLFAKYDSKGKKYICRKALQHRRPRPEGGQIVIYHYEEKQFFEDIQLYLNAMFRKSIISILSKIDNVYYLPASRSGLYRALNAFSQIFVELAKKRNFLRAKIVLPSISEQDSDYFSKISEINIRRINQKFNSIAENIENNLLKGKVSFDQTTKQILFHPENIDINFELLGTSSMIAEVSPIVLYLRHIIIFDKDSKDTSAKPIIFIEEPEAHLHPAAQITLMECFVNLVKLGAKLVITSHSNYMFQKLNNLIAEKEIDKEIINGMIFFQDKKGSCSKTIPISDIGMEDHNFIDIAENLYNEKIRIIEKMEMDDAGQN